MPTTIRLPKALHRAEFHAASAKVGDAIREGDPIATFSRKNKLETLSSTASGVVLRILVAERLECETGDPIALVGEAGEEVGYDPSQIECVRLELLNKCSACNNDYPLNGLVEEIRCTRCGDVQTLGAAFWQEELVEDVTFARKPGKRGGGECLGGPTIECRGFPPFCRKCGTLIAMDALTQAWGEAAKSGRAEIACSGCKETYGARQPPEWAREVFAGLAFLVGETSVEPSSEAPKPVIFKCPNCTASLSIAGGKRVVTCQYCESEVFLPDELWLHMNPGAKKTQWWMLLEPQKRKR